MAAPSGTVWGSIVGGYGRIGIYKSLSSTETTTTVTVELWFWSKYSVSDSANTLYYNNLSASGSATTSVGSVSVSTTVASGDGWSTSNQVKLKSYSYSYTRGTSAVTRYLYAKLADIDRVGGTMYVSTSFSVPKLSSYTVAYNANNGSGAPSSQTKWYGKTLVLSSAKPTRTGYTFKGWATSASGSVAYASGANYTANAAVTLYAVWQANTYTVSYNANGGSGAPSNQTKTYGTTLKLSSTKPTRANYTFKGWGTSASGNVVYASGANYTANAAVTLYAVWELAYVSPIIHSLTAARCNSVGAAADDGTYGLISFEWECTNAVSSIEIAWESKTAENGSATVSASGTIGSVSEIVGAGLLSSETTYTITVTVTDSGGDSNAKTTLNGAVFPIDFLAGGKGVAFGKPAELVGVADFALDAKFNKPVYGKALGMDRLPAIPADSDFNDYMETGCYAVKSNAIAATCANIPVERAGRLEVWSSTGEGVRLEQWSYLRQRFVPYNNSNAVWERDVARGEDNVWIYYDWWQSTLTPAVSKKVYDKAAMTISLGSNSVLGVTGSYTKIPLNTNVLSTSGRLTLSSNSIRIGAGISHVKVSGQVLSKFGSTAGNRHVRIQKVSGSTTKSLAWDCIYGVASSNTLFPFTPVIAAVAEGDLLNVVYYTSDAADSIASGSSANGWQTYLTVEEL